MTPCEPLLTPGPPPQPPPRDPHLSRCRFARSTSGGISGLRLKRSRWGGGRGGDIIRAGPGSGRRLEGGAGEGREAPPPPGREAPPPRSPVAQGVVDHLRHDGAVDHGRVIDDSAGPVLPHDELAGGGAGRGAGSGVRKPRPPRGGGGGAQDPRHEALPPWGRKPRPPGGSCRTSGCRCWRRPRPRAAPARPRPLGPAPRRPPAPARPG